MLNAYLPMNSAAEACLFCYKPVLENDILYHCVELAWIVFVHWNSSLFSKDVSMPGRELNN